MASNADVIAPNKAPKKKELPEALKVNVWQPGKSGNPKGRAKGSRHKFSECFMKDFLADWEMAGAGAIQRVRLEEPAAYLRVAASLIPKELNIKEGSGELDRIIEQFSDEQLDNLIVGLATVGLTAKGAAHKAKALAGGKSDSVH